ncbi:hypothetical protein [Nitratireductor sp. StC3]|uniref:hypothetical protein n=1 Tax=Nitratireductor sp. StC3 TaxID=2126741 RepID=UPI000D0CFF26|nr:hypothetical protein [Nitratireductor sp. StC3]PSM16464.1 hypothetical protein C7T96_20645 [Nitratireductor sp. StC3]
MNAFCASENFDAFIVFRSSQPRDVTAENSSFERSSFQGSEQWEDHALFSLSAGEEVMELIKHHNMHICVTAWR